LLSAVVAAFHADVVTMMAVAIPIYGMYEVSILFIRLFGRRDQEEPVLAPVPAPGPGLDPPVTPSANRQSNTVNKPGAFN
jgi:Sec-independent protein secretion pathway component TatC